MNLNDIAARLRAFADEIEGGSKAERKAIESVPSVIPRKPEAKGDTLEVVVGYWKVATTSSGKPMAKLGYTDDAGERVYLPCFEESVMMRVDPLIKGDAVTLTVKPWKDTRCIVNIVKASRPSSGISESEIPF